MKKKGKYQYLFDQYPPIITKDKFYRICNVSKKTAAHLLDNGLVPCTNSGKQTRKYKIKLEDVIDYLETREVDPGKFAAPYGWYKAKMKPGCVWQEKNPALRKLRNPAPQRRPLVLSNFNDHLLIAFANVLVDS